MQKAVSRNIGIFLTAFILLTCVAMLSPSLGRAGMHELSDRDLAMVYASGFSTFTLVDGLARVDFNNVTMSTWTTIDSMKTGYYNNGTTTAWDNDWTSVSLGSSANDLVATGFYIEAKFSNTSDPATRKLEYVRIGTTNLSGDISADFNSFSGSINGTTYSRVNLGTAKTVTAATGTGFYLSLDRSAGYSFHWVNGGSITP